jgi:hypothetical protein
MAATISYGPRRVPVVSAKECRDYMVMSLTGVENFSADAEGCLGNDIEGALAYSYPQTRFLQHLRPANIDHVSQQSVEVLRRFEDKAIASGSVANSAATRCPIRRRARSDRLSKLPTVLLVLESSVTCRSRWRLARGLFVFV